MQSKSIQNGQFSKNFNNLMYALIESLVFVCLNIQRIQQQENQLFIISSTNEPEGCFSKKDLKLTRIDIHYQLIHATFDV